MGRLRQLVKNHVHKVTQVESNHSNVGSEVWHLPHVVSAPGGCPMQAEKLGVDGSTTQRSRYTLVSSVCEGVGEGYIPHLDIEEAEAQVCHLLWLSLSIMGLRPEVIPQKAYSEDLSASSGTTHCHCHIQLLGSVATDPPITVQKQQNGLLQGTGRQAEHQGHMSPSQGHNMHRPRTIVTG